MKTTSGMEENKLSKAPKIKAVITDLDGTLWRGGVAEKQKLSLNSQYFEFLKILQRKGIQIIAVSKNDQADVRKAFRKLGIDRGLFTIVVANWDPKYLNIEKIILRTELRPETIVFIDDNPMERIEVGVKLPELHLLDSTKWQVLKKQPVIEAMKNQSAYEVATRINRYRTSFKVGSSQRTPKENIRLFKKFDRQVSVGEIDVDYLDRFAHLLVETHRINFNPGKFSHYDKALEYLHRHLNGGGKLFAVSTRESGCSLGLTGALVADIKKNRAVISDGTFSCGIIGRGFEQKTMLVVIQKLKLMGIDRLEVCVSLTSTNIRVRELLVELGFSEKRKHENEAIFDLDLRKYRIGSKYHWIKHLKDSPELGFTQIPTVREFFDEKVRPLVSNGWKIINLGAGKGEVLGHLDKEVRKDFYQYLKEKRVSYKKIDVENYPSEQNVIADAENLKDLIRSESQDLVIALEVLEHTAHFWRVINEMIRICRKGGYIFITCPSFDYPKHEYPIDVWRIGPRTLSGFFKKPNFRIVHLVKEGNKKQPHRTLLLVKKVRSFTEESDLPGNGKTNWETGLTVFS